MYISHIIRLKFTSNIGNFVQYYQGDYSQPWGGGTIKTSGCGPTSFAMVITNLTGKRITPVDTTSWCGPKTYYEPGIGTSWSYFSGVTAHFNRKFNYNITYTQTSSIDEVYNALQNGKLVISSQTSGLFTSNGHFIVLAGVKNGGIVVRDPNKNNAVNKGYNDRIFTKAEIDASAMNYWIFSK